MEGLQLEEREGAGGLMDGAAGDLGGEFDLIAAQTVMPPAVATALDAPFGLARDTADPAGQVTNRILTFDKSDLSGDGGAACWRYGASGGALCEAGQIRRGSGARHQGRPRPAGGHTGHKSDLSTKYFFLLPFQARYFQQAAASGSLHSPGLALVEAVTLHSWDRLVTSATLSTNLDFNCGQI